jgi:hypothetical protein
VLFHWNNSLQVDNRTHPDFEPTGLCSNLWSTAVEGTPLMLYFSVDLVQGRFLYQHTDYNTDNYQSVWRQHIMMLLIKTITLVLNVSTYIITSTTAVRNEIYMTNLEVTNNYVSWLLIHFLYQLQKWYVDYTKPVTAYRFEQRPVGSKSGCVLLSTCKLLFQWNSTYNKD